MKALHSPLHNFLSEVSTCLFVARLAVFCCVPFLLAAVLSAQSITVSQPTIWASKPDVAAFEKIENDRLAAGRAAIDQMIAVKGARTIENTLALYDEAVRQNNAAGYFCRTDGAGSS